MQNLKTDRNIGPALRRLRKENRLTQDVLAYPCAAHPCFETGEWKLSISLLAALKDLYQCSCDDFFEGIRPGGREA